LTGGGFLHQLDRQGRNLAPGSLTLIFILLGMVPVPLPGWEAIAPQLSLVSVYYWAIHRPDLLPPWLAFLFGVLADLTSGALPGLTAVGFLIVHAAVLSQRRILSRGNFLILWAGFAGVALLVALASYVLVSAINVVLLPLNPVLLQAVLTTAAFPMVAAACLQLHRAFLVVE
jgi:rod shape-determining protein MreD